MRAAEDRRGIDQAMQALPAAPQASHGALRGSHRERDEQQQRRKADRDEGALRNVLEQHTPIQTLVHKQVEKEMHRDVEKCEQAQHAPESQQARPADEFAQRRHGECRQQESQAPDAERVLDFLDGIRAERRARPAR